MDVFLNSTKKKLSDNTAVHVVIGNEACDLDSTVCALVYAYYLAQKSDPEKGLIVPVLNIHKEDYRLRTEVTFYLRKHGISEDMLIFRDNLDLHKSHKDGNLKLTLVDFNVFRDNDVVLEESVTEVIDHHQKERLDKDGVSVTLELVGSCCTLVAEKLLGDSSISLDRNIAELLYGGVVLDTVCLAPKAGRTTPRDEEIVQKLEAILTDIDRKKTFDELQTAKSDVSELSTIDVLRKDMKKITSKNLSIAISSIPVKLETFLAADGVPRDVAAFGQQQNVHVVVLMTLYVTQDGAAHRQIGVYSQDDNLRDQITETLKNSQDPNLQLEPLPASIESCRCFDQNNLTASRKKVLPLLQAHLNAEDTPDSAVTSDGGVDLTSSVTSSLEQDSGIAPSDLVDLLSPVDSLRSQQNVTGRSEEPGTPQDIDDIGDLDFSLVTGGGDHGDSGLLDGLSEISPLPSSMSTPDQQLSHPTTPPNTFTESNLEGYREHMLPSFNNLEMVKKIRDKQDMLEGAIGEEVGSGDETYTPHNSVTDTSLPHYAREHNLLPSFYNPETVTKIRNKRSDFDFEGGDDELKPGSTPFTPPNSYANSYAESPMDGAKATRWESGHDFLGQVEEEVRRRSVTGEMMISSHDALDEVGPHTNVVASRIAKNMLVDAGDFSEGRAQARSEYAFTNPAFQNGYSPDEEALIYHGDNDMDVAYQIAQEIIQKALDRYVSSLTQDELIEFSSRKYNDHTLETEYLSKLDPFKGKPDLVGDITSTGELAESESFNRLHSFSDDTSDVTTSFALTGATEDESSTDPGFKPALKLRGAVVSESSTDSDRATGILKLEGPTSGESSTDGPPGLSEGVQDFLIRLNPEGSAVEDDPVKAKHRLESARIIVDQAIKQACKIYQKELSLKMAEDDGDTEEMKRLKDQAPEYNGDPLKAPHTPPRKKKIMPNVDLLQDMGEELSSGVVPASIGSSEPDLLSVEETRKAEELSPNDVLIDNVLDPALDGDLDWESDDEEKGPPVEPIPEYTAREEFDDARSWRNVSIGDKQYRIDMKVIEPYKKVLSHGGYYGDGFNAIIVFAGCNLPDKGRRDYSYVMDNLFLYVISTLELLVVEDYMMVYFHGATPKQKMPSLRWLKRCYDMISRRLKKNLKSLLIVHPTLWLKTIVLMTKPFISSKFYSKIKYVKSLPELGSIIPMDYVFIPDEIKVMDDKYRGLGRNGDTSTTDDHGEKLTVTKKR